VRISTPVPVGVIVALLGLADASPARAQSGTAYTAGGPLIVRGLGGRDFAWQMDAGGEKNYGPYGIGAGAGFVFFPKENETFDGGRGSASAPAFGTAAISLHETYYPGRTRRARRMQPFVTGSIVWMVAKEAPPLLGIGGGVDWWTTPKRGLRCEAHYQLVWLAFRCGVVLR